MKRILAAAVAMSAALTIGGIAPANAQVLPNAGFFPRSGQTLYGLTTTNRIVTFSTGFSALATNDVPVTGLSAGEQLIGIDRRPRTGVIYGVGKLGTAGRLYTVDPTTGVATFVADLVGAPTATAPRGGPIVLSGTEFGFDFNPVPDALRITSDTGQNLRVIPGDRTPATGPALRAGDTFTDGVLNADVTPATGVTAAAYTNNLPMPTSTTLFDLDTRRDLLVRQDPPNAGTLVTVGSLRFPVGTVAGFDIVTAGGIDTAYAAINLGVAPFTFLAQIDLSTGQATVLSVAAFPHTLRGLAA